MLVQIKEISSSAESDMSGFDFLTLTVCHMSSPPFGRRNLSEGGSFTLPKSIIRILRYVYLNKK